MAAVAPAALFFPIGIVVVPAATMKPVVKDKRKHYDPQVVHREGIAAFYNRRNIPAGMAAISYKVANPSYEGYCILFHRID